MKYSIVLPVRNGGEYIKQCVSSILGQTMPEFNLIVLDNNSSDGTGAYIKSIKDSRIILYESPRSLTIEENWARITKIKKNEFITLIGHDDLLGPDYLSIMDELIRRFPDASLYQSYFNFIDNNGREIKKCKP